MSVNLPSKNSAAANNLPILPNNSNDDEIDILNKTKRERPAETSENANLRKMMMISIQSEMTWRQRRLRSLPKDQSYLWVFPCWGKVETPNLVMRPLGKFSQMVGKFRLLLCIRMPWTLQIHYILCNGPKVAMKKEKSQELQKEPDDESGDDNDDKIKEKPTNEKYEFLGNRLKNEFDFDSWLNKLLKIGTLLYGDNGEDSGDENGDKFTLPQQKGFKVVTEKTWFEKSLKDVISCSWEKFKVATSGKNLYLCPP
jgi:hypothetical protein